MLLHMSYMATRTTRARALNDEALYAYLQSKEPPEHPELTKLREVTRTLPRGRMQIAPEQGHFLTLLARLIGARRLGGDSELQAHQDPRPSVAVGGRLHECPILPKLLAARA